LFLPEIQRKSIRLRQGTFVQGWRKGLLSKIVSESSDG
jgi:hypothetical protein